VLDERPAWTMSELCQRLSLPYDPPTRSSVGRVLSELNVKCIRGSRDVRVYGRGGNNQVSAKLALEVAQTAERWTTSELLGVLGWPVNKSTQVQLGRVLAQGGWIRSRNPVASNRVAVYKKTLAPVQASS
jgi:transposase